MTATWKTRNRSFYYEGAPEPDDLDLKPQETALLVIDVQNTYVERPDRAKLSPAEQAHAVRRPGHYCCAASARSNNR